MIHTDSSGAFDLSSGADGGDADGVRDLLEPESVGVSDQTLDPLSTEVADQRLMLLLRLWQRPVQLVHTVLSLPGHSFRLLTDGQTLIPAAKVGVLAGQQPRPHLSPRVKD